jgi:hypothetical protein
LLLLWKASTIQGVSGSLFWASNGSLDCEIVVLPLSLATQCCLLPCFLMSSIQCGLCEGKGIVEFSQVWVMYEAIHVQHVHLLQYSYYSLNHWNSIRPKAWWSTNWATSLYEQLYGSILPLPFYSLSNNCWQ